MSSKDNRNENNNNNKNRYFPIPKFATAKPHPPYEKMASSWPEFYKVWTFEIWNKPDHIPLCESGWDVILELPRVLEAIEYWMRDWGYWPSDSDLQKQGIKFFGPPSFRKHWWYVKEEDINGHSKTLSTLFLIPEEMKYEQIELLYFFVQECGYSARWTKDFIPRRLAHDMVSEIKERKKRDQRNERRRERYRAAKEEKKAFEKNLEHTDDNEGVVLEPVPKKQRSEEEAPITWLAIQKNSEISGPCYDLASRRAIDPKTGRKRITPSIVCGNEDDPCPSPPPVYSDSEKEDDDDDIVYPNTDQKEKVDKKVEDEKDASKDKVDKKDDDDDGEDIGYDDDSDDSGDFESCEDDSDDDEEEDVGYSGNDGFLAPEGEVEYEEGFNSANAPAPLAAPPDLPPPTEASPASYKRYYSTIKKLEEQWTH
jgi:hypothetical protein